MKAYLMFGLKVAAVLLVINLAASLAGLTGYLYDPATAFGLKKKAQ